MWCPNLNRQNILPVKIVIDYLFFQINCQKNWREGRWWRIQIQNNLFVFPGKGTSFFFFFFLISLFRKYLFNSLKFKVWNWDNIVLETYYQLRKFFFLSVGRPWMITSLIKILITMRKFYFFEILLQQILL